MRIKRILETLNYIIRVINKLLLISIVNILKKREAVKE